MSDWQLIASDGFRGELGGEGSIFGANGFQDITILSGSGSVDLDPSFNKGGDIVRLEGDAADWQIVRSGSSVTLTQGSTSVSIPVGSAGLALVFADGARTLRIDDADGIVIGDQAVTGTALAIEAAPEDGPLPTGEDDAAVARLLLDTGAEVTAGGNLEVFGTDGAEQISLTGGNVLFDPSFNKGGDTLILGGDAADFSAVRSGSSVLFQGEGLNLELPVGPDGVTLQFDDGQRELVYEGLVNGVLFGTQTIGLSPTVLEAVAGAPLDQVLFWNEVALDAIASTSTIPAAATRALALQSIAAYDAICSICDKDGFWIDVKMESSADIAAAVAYASYVTLKDLFPAASDFLDAKLQEAMPNLGTGDSFANGSVVGTAIGQAVLALRTIDGYDTVTEFEPQEGPGYWSPAAPATPEAPQWAYLTPFLLTTPDQFRAPVPPELNSAEYADALNAVKEIGAIDSAIRTEEQTEIALFWRDGLGTYTPPGHWNYIAQIAAEETGGSTVENALTFALLNVALADAAVAAWDTKYTYDVWRPSVAIRNADLDGNELTEADPTWTPLFKDPSHPDYVSGHSTFSAAGATVLASIFGEDFAFSVDSIGLPGVTRQFENFEEAALEAGISRVYGGIHTSLANEEGYNLGAAVGSWVLDQFLIA